MYGINRFVTAQNNKKILFTPGPGPLLEENIAGLNPCFSRGDVEYQRTESTVLTFLRNMSGHDNVVPFQGSGTLALEVSVKNFVFGKVLVVNSGYYSNRLLSIVKTNSHVNQIDVVDWKDIDNIYGNYDWILACYTETSIGLKLPIFKIKNLKKKTKSKLFLDATASIGLENNHEIAEVISYSSCKGLFGLTGACFIAYNIDPTVEADSFYLNINTHINKKVTGPYHTICSLLNVLPKHNDFKNRVIESKAEFLKRMNNHLVFSLDNQPLLCTHVNRKVTPIDERVIMYQPRSNIEGSVVCHLGAINGQNVLDFIQ